MDCTVDKWVAGQLDLLRLEQEAEAEELRAQIDRLSPAQAQDKGVSILGLEVEATRSALMGRVSRTLSRRDGTRVPSHSFKVGDEVKLSSSKSNKTEEPLFGIISSVGSSVIEVISEEDDLSLVPPLRLDLYSSEQTYRKIVESLQKLPRISHPMLNLLFHGARVESAPIKAIIPFNSALNTSQIGAVEHALSSSPCALIHGPPGEYFLLNLIRKSLFVPYRNRENKHCD